jgi:hypothetical protein
MPLNRAQIQQAVKSLLEEHRDGLRWSDILRRVRESSPDTPGNSVQGATFALFRDDEEIVKVSRGFYRLAKYDAVERQNTMPDTSETTIVEVSRPGQEPAKLREQDFYEPFAEWLRDDLNDVINAVPLGGALFRSKWGTPDVIGVLKPLASDLIKFDAQIVSAEIKIDTAQPVVAFGQAVAYKLFSHKAYVVMPSTMQEPDYDRLVALCGIHGIGLVTFDLDKEDPNFTIRVNAQFSQPDMLFVNEMARQFSDGARKQYNKLF